METINRHNEAAIKKLMQDESLLSASSDFTIRVMKQVETYSRVSGTLYKPLIGMKGWIIILTSVIMLIACCIMILVNGDYTSAGYLSFFEFVFGFLRDLEILWNVHIGSIFTGTVVFVSIVILLSVDFVFNTSITTE